MMENATLTVEKDGTIVIKINPKIRLRPSASGKNTLVATGKASVPTADGGTLAIQVNAYTKAAG